MKASKKLLSLLLALVMVVAMVVPAMAEEEGIMLISETPEESGKIVILHTNDVHCDIANYAKVAAYRDEMAAAYGAENVVLVDAGDAVQGGPIGTLTKGEYLVNIMNQVGYDYITLGNHEFDYEVPRMKELMEKQNATVLSSNFIDLTTNEAVFKGYEVASYGDVKVAFVGITTPESFTKSTPAYFQDENGEYVYSFCEGNKGADLYANVQASVDAAKAEGADYVIAIGHLGIEETSAPWRSTDVIANTTGIDALIDGHSHSTIDGEKVANKDGVEIVLNQTGTKLANIGKVVIDTEAKTVSAELVSLKTYETVNEETKTFIDGVNEEFQAVLDEVVAKTDVTLTTLKDDGSRAIRSQETNLGDLCADAYRTILEADVAFVNGGGIRANIDAGDVTYGQIINVHPYSNQATSIKVTGQQLLDALEMGAKNAPGESGGFLHVSGLTYTIDATIPSSITTDDKGNFVSVDGAYRVKDVKVGEEDLVLDKEYVLASHDYMLLNAGDGMTMFKGAEVVKDRIMPDNEILIKYIVDGLGGTVGEAYAAPQGRITVIKTAVDTFDDVTADDWFADAVNYVFANKLMGGTQTGFEPSANLSKAQMLQMLYNLAGRPEVTADAEPWYAAALAWAGSEGIVDADSFAEGDITRGETVELLTKYFAKQDLSINGLFKGDGEGNVNLDQNLNRAELATILTRVPELKKLGTEALTTKVIDLGKYGNASTDIKMDAFTAAGFTVGDMIKVEITGVEEPLVFPYGTGYSNVDQGDPIALANKAGTLDLALSRSDFGTKYGLGVKGEDGVYTITEGKTITISMAEKGAYLKEMELRDIDSKRTNVREDYASDEVFANFREIKMGDIAEGVLYRTSSPVNPELGRSTYADKFVEANGVKTVVNLADSQEVMEGYEGYADTYYSTLNVLPLNMGVDMQADDAKAKLKDAFEFMIANEGPYAFHCKEGKDRAGYFAIVLEALMGGTKDEIVADYMVTYENYYHVEKDSEQWTGLAQRNVIKDLMKLAGVETEEELAEADLAAAVEKYLTEEIGLTAEQVTALKGVLSTPVAAEEAKAA